MLDVIELMAGPARLRLIPALGGRITALRLAVRGTAEAHDLLMPFPERTGSQQLLHWPKGGIYPLLPYGNRIRNARLSFRGFDYELPQHPDAAPHTLHGHAHRTAWRVTHVNGSSAEWVLEHHGGEWPWRFSARLSAELSPSDVRLQISVRNDATTAMPAGLGLHPYFAHDRRDAVGFRTTIDWPVTRDFLAGPPQDVPVDYEPPQTLPEGPVTLYRSGWDGYCEIHTIRGDVLRLQASPVFNHLVVHRPAGATYLCVEPTTHAPDGFNATEAGIEGAGRITLDPGETLSGSVSISLDRNPQHPYTNRGEQDQSKASKEATSHAH